MLFGSSRYVKTPHKARVQPDVGERQHSLESTKAHDIVILTGACVADELSEVSLYSLASPKLLKLRRGCVRTPAIIGTQGIHP